MIPLALCAVVLVGLGLVRVGLPRASRPLQTVAALSLGLGTWSAAYAAQWMAFQAITLGGLLVIPDRVDRLQPAEVLRLAEREGVRCIPVVGDAIARPLMAEIQAGDYDLCNVLLVTNGGAALSPTVRDALKARIIERFGEPLSSGG